MQTIESRDIDKSSWPPGIWHDEPDKIQWPDEATGYACLMVRHPRYGHWCGYVGVPAGHPFHGDDPLEEVAPSNAVECHHGLNYGSACAGIVCHVRDAGDPEVWWLGFDCAHFEDRSPGTDMPPFEWEIYRDVSYVKAECANIAAQCAAAEVTT